MRIITSSKLKDYYDRFSDPTDNQNVWVREAAPVQHTVLDRHYRRLESYVPIKDGLILGVSDPEIEPAYKKQGDHGPFDLRNILSTNYRDPWLREYQSIQLVFCGVLYRGIMYTEQVRIGNKYTGFVQTRYRVYWTIEQFAADHAEKIDLRTKSLIQIDDVLDPDRRPKTKAHAWFTPVGSPDVAEMCVTLNTPVIMRVKRCPWDRDGKSRIDWMKNPTWLDTVQFFKLMDPQTAFQELDMFVGGVMVRHDKPEVVPDKLKVLAHGMDHMSFRKDPTKVHY